MNTSQLYFCPCCSYLTLNQKPPGTYLICPICFWEDDAVGFYFWSGSNQVTLNQAQLNFIQFGACEQDWLDYVRPVTGDDIRDHNWEPLAVMQKKAKLALIQKIITAFDGVNLEDGISLHAAKALDDWCSEEGARKIGQEKDWEIRWQDISDEKIEVFREVFTFSDLKGFRFYLPAYMIWTLKNDENMDSNSSVSLIYALENRKKFYKPKFEFLNPAQKQAALDYLQFIKSHWEWGCYA